MTDEDEGMDARRAFVRYMGKHGVAMPGARRLVIQPPLDDSGDTDCWTYAARYVAEHPGSSYVEGICWLPPDAGKARVAAHAWVVEDTPFGSQIVEFTPGYERATGYRGLPINTDSEEFQRADDGERRYSVLELMIAIGATP